MERGRQSDGLTAETIQKRPERLWTAARTMEVLRRCPLAIAQRLVHCAIAVSTAVLDRVTETMSVALLLMNNLDNSMQKMSNLLSPAPPPIHDLLWANLRVQPHLPPLRYLDLLIPPGTLKLTFICMYFKFFSLKKKKRSFLSTCFSVYWCPFQHGLYECTCTQH